MAKSKYEKNYIEGGYHMNYEKPNSFRYHRNHVFQFKIQLEEIEPLIWRRILVPSDYNFWDLHVAIQDAMGWQDSHLHHFEIRKKGSRQEARIGIPDLYNTGEVRRRIASGNAIFRFYASETSDRNFKTANNLRLSHKTRLNT